MALSFITGRAGSGKSTYILEKIKNSNEKAVIIVPEQVSLSMEKMAVDHIGYLGNNYDVLSFLTTYTLTIGICYKKITTFMKIL